MGCLEAVNVHVHIQPAEEAGAEEGTCLRVDLATHLSEGLQVALLPLASYMVVGFRQMVQDDA